MAKEADTLNYLTWTTYTVQRTTRAVQP